MTTTPARRESERFHTDFSGAATIGKLVAHTGRAREVEDNERVIEDCRNVLGHPRVIDGQLLIK